MTGSFITISIVGLVAGFIFSMPVAGPISILVTTNALRGRVRYCHRVTIGASFVTFIYVFLAVYGLSKLYSLYKPLIPGLLIMGSLFLLFIGYRIYMTKFDFENIKEDIQLKERIRLQGRGGFYTGLIINLLNPTLFIGWLSSTFLVITFVTSLGFNMGGLDIMVDRGVKEIGSMEVNIPGNTKLFAQGNIEPVTKEINPANDTDENNLPSNYHLLISLFYAIFIATGSITWFWLLSLILNRFRNHVNIKILAKVIQSMGAVLCLFGIYFGWLAAYMIFNYVG